MTPEEINRVAEDISPEASAFMAGFEAGKSQAFHAWRDKVAMWALGAIINGNNGMLYDENNMARQAKRAYDYADLFMAERKRRREVR